MNQNSKSGVLPLVDEKWARGKNKKHKLKFVPKIGEEVAVCYDCKWTRAKKGVIVSCTPRTFSVKFIPWSNEEAGEVALVVPKKNPCIDYYGSFLRKHGENGIMRHLLGVKGGDWYSVIPVKVLKYYGYAVK